MPTRKASSREASSSDEQLLTTDRKCVAGTAPKAVRGREKDGECRLRKKRRPAPSSRESPTACTTSNKTASLKANILSLPDEAISRIFYYLKSSYTSGILDKPRHAFALALTNTRLLDIFRTHLTRITPDMEYEGGDTLRPPHLISVLSLAGHWLRELNVPNGAWEILPHLSKLCPRLEKLSLREHMFNSTVCLLTCAERLFPQLRSLSIIQPTQITLNLLLPPPAELVLKEVSGAWMKDLMLILRDPPNKLYLHLKETQFYDTDDFLAALHGACPKMEQVTVISDFGEQNGTEVFLDDALRYLDIPRHNHNSKCMKMTIEGDFMELIRHAHPKAFLEVTRMTQTFVKDRDQVYVTKLPLLDEYLTQDLSRLEEVYVVCSAEPSAEWGERLSAVHLSRAIFGEPQKAARLCHRVDVVEIPAMTIDSRVEWGFLKFVRKVRVLGFWFASMSKDRTVDFLKSFADMLNHFRGEVVAIHKFPIMWINNASDPLVQPMRDLISAIRVFEARGGDAPSIRAWALNSNAYFGIGWY